MARWLLDCYPLCGHPWKLGLATDADEVDQALRLRHDVFLRELGYRPGAGADGRDVDAFDEWCDHLVLVDTSRRETIGTYRAIRGAEAVRRGGFYAAAEFDMRPLDPIAPRILQGSRACVAAGHRNGPAIQYLNYGMDRLLREADCDYFLGAESFTPADAHALNVIHSYIREYGMDDTWRVDPMPGCRVESLREVPVTPADERVLPPVVRLDLRLGFRSCSVPAWDPEFHCYDVLMLGRRDRFTPLYRAMVDRVERGAVAGVG